MTLHYTVRPPAHLLIEPAAIGIPEQRKKALAP